MLLHKMEVLFEDPLEAYDNFHSLKSIFEESVNGCGISEEKATYKGNY